MLLLLATAEAVFSYGPAGCVHVGRSSAGTCVFRTECEKDVDLKEVEVAFVCASNGEEVEHVFEKGSLTNSKLFDTEVKCAKCLPSQSQHVLMKDDSDEEKEESKAKEESKEESKDEAKEESKDEAKEESKDEAKEGSEEEAKEESKEEAKEEEVEESAEVKAAKEMVPVAPATASFYGPASCIATFLGPAGSCIMQTACKDVEGLSGYQYGLTCVDDKGDSVRHMFGADSFDPVETFDTRIECSLCLGLGSAVPAGDVTETVAALKEEVAELKKDMSEVKAKIAPAEKASEEKATEETTEEKSEEKSEETSEETSTEEATTAEGEEAASLLHRAPPKVHVPPAEKVEYHTRAFLKKGGAKVRHHMPQNEHRHAHRQ
jgi:hypothetical protein